MDSLDTTHFPIYQCNVIENWKDLGMSSVHVIRSLPNGTYVFVSYLIDFWCLGLKDSFSKVGVAKSELRHLFKNSSNYITISYQEARSLILGAIDYAKAIEILPHSSWDGFSSSFIEGNQPYEKIFTFGKDGAPFYFAGPRDYENYNVNEVVAKVIEAKGDYMVHVPSHL